MPISSRDYAIAMDGLRKKRNIKRERSLHFKYHLKAAYGITVEDYNEILKKQDFKCAICKNKLLGGKQNNLDHCHRTEKIRGILCVDCNLGIGKLKDSIEILEAALKYLKDNI